MLTTSLLHLLILLTSWSFYENEPYSKRFHSSVATGEIKDELLSEVSGIVASRKNKGLFWVINDSGNDPKLFLINKNGTTIHSYWINGAINHDWEDISIYSNPTTDETKIYIGDIGDNQGVRDNINIIEIIEPFYDESADTLIKVFNNYSFEYEDGARDAETLIIDPITGSLIIISKREEHVGIYETPEILDATDNMQLTKKGILPFHNVTSGDISSDGNEILLKNYNAIFYYRRKKNESILKALSKNYELLTYNPEPQGESICWSVDAEQFFTLSELSWSEKQVMYSYSRNLQN